MVGSVLVFAGLAIDEIPGSKIEDPCDIEDKGDEVELEESVVGEVELKELVFMNCVGYESRLVGSTEVAPREEEVVACVKLVDGKASFLEAPYM